MLLNLGFNTSAINFLEITQDGVLVLDMSGVVRYANPAFSKLFGIAGEKLLNQNCNTLNCEPVINFDELIRTLTSKHSETHHVICKKADGSCLQLTANSSFLKDDAVIHKGVLVVLKNSLLETEEEKTFLAQQNLLLRSLNYRTDEVCMLYDLKNFRNLFCSDTIEQILGWTSAEYHAGGMAFSLSITHPDDGETAQEFFLSEIKKRKASEAGLDLTPIILEYRKRHKNGSYKWMRTESWALSRDEHHELSRMIVFMKDITIEKIRTQLNHNPNILELIQNGIEHIKINGDPYITPVISVNGLHLSTREKEILGLVKKGFSTKEIATKLSLTINTVNTYRKNLMNKLHAKNSAELVKIAMEQDIT